MRSAHCMCRSISARQSPGAAATIRGCNRRGRRTGAGGRPFRDGEAESRRSSFVGWGRWTSFLPPSTRLSPNLSLPCRRATPRSRSLSTASRSGCFDALRLPQTIQCTAPCLACRRAKGLGIPAVGFNQWWVPTVEFTGGAGVAAERIKTDLRSLIRGAAFASLRVLVRLVRAPFGPADESEEGEELDRQRIHRNGSRKTSAHLARNL